MSAAAVRSLVRTPSPPPPFPQSMMLHSRATKQSSTREFEGTTADLSRKAREAERGFSGGPGSTCTVAEALRRTKLIQSRSPQINPTTYSFASLPQT